MSTALLFLKGSFARTLETLVGISIGFFLLPFLIRHLGEGLYGIWILVSSLTAAFYLFDLGFASAVTRFVARHISKGEYDRVNQIISSSLLIYTILALIIILVTLATAAAAPYWIEDTASEKTIQILIIITGTSLALEFPFKSFAGVTSSYMRYDLISYSRLFFKVASTAAIIYFVLNGHQLVTLAVVNFVAQLLSNISFYSISRYVYKQMKIRPSFIRKDAIKDLFSYSAWAFLVDITQLAKNKADIFIIGGLLSPAILATYYVGARLADYALEFLRKAMNMTTPIFARAHALDDMNDLGLKVVLFCRLNIILSGLCAIPLIALGEGVIANWMGPDFDTATAYSVLVFLAIGKLLLFAFSPLSSCLYAISKHQFQAWIELGEAAASIPLSIILIKYGNLGVLGAAIGITVPYYVTRTIILPLTTLREIGFSRRQFYIRISPLVIYATSFCGITKLLVSPYSRDLPFFPLAGVIAASCLLYGIVSYIFLCPEERAHIKALVHKLKPGKPRVQTSQ